MPSRVRPAWCLLALVSSLAWGQPLPAEVDAALTRSRLPRDAVAVFVAPVGGPPKVAHRPDAPLNPASLAKLETTFAALDLLGPAYTWTTQVYAEGTLQGGVLQGHLFLKGQGDPKLVAERLWLLMRRVQALGIRQVTGDIVLDRGAFELPAHDPSAFDGEPWRPHNVGPDALLVNFKSVLLTFTPEAGAVRVQAEPSLAGVQWPANVAVAPGDCADWRAAVRLNTADPQRPRFEGAYPASCGAQTWPLAFAEPASYAARAIGAMWREAGGQLGGQVREGRVPAGLKPMLEWPSLPLADIVRDINKYSNNVMAQQVFLTLGLQQRGRGTPEAAREVLRTWWRERIGGEPPVMDNGSGLSRSERASVRQLAELLQTAWNSPLMPDLAASLPLAGVDGTLRRARRTSGLAHLKTGSLRDVAGVAGYVHGASGQRYVLVAIANHPQAHAFRGVIDALVEWAAREP